MPLSRNKDFLAINPFWLQNVNSFFLWGQHIFIDLWRTSKTCIFSSWRIWLWKIRIWPKNWLKIKISKRTFFGGFWHHLLSENAKKQSVAICPTLSAIFTGLNRESLFSWMTAIFHSISRDIIFADFRTSLKFAILLAYNILNIMKNTITNSICVHSFGSR